MRLSCLGLTRDFFFSAAATTADSHKHNFEHIAEDVPLFTEDAPSKRNDEVRPVGVEVEHFGNEESLELNLPNEKFSGRS